MDSKRVAAAVGLFVLVWAFVVFCSRMADGSDGSTGEGEEVYDRERVLTALLAGVSGALRRGHIKHWLMYRTLLGFINSQSLLSDDYDVDLGICSEDRQSVLEILASEMPRDLFTIIPDGGASDLGIQVVHTATGLTLELTTFAVNMEAKTMEATTPSKWLRQMFNHRTLQLRIDWIFPLRAGDMCGNIEVPVPAQPNVLLQNWYGIQAPTTISHAPLSTQP